MELTIKKRAFTNVYPAGHGEYECLFDCDTDELVFKVKSSDVISRGGGNQERYCMVDVNDITVYEYVEREEK